MQYRHAGADWIAHAYGVELSPLGRKVADFLGQVARGIYHWDSWSLRHTDWANTYRIRVAVPSHLLATWDFPHLAELVIGAHDLCLRMELEPAGPRRIALVFHQRRRQGSTTERHPTLEESIERTRALLAPILEEQC